MKLTRRQALALYHKREKKFALCWCATQAYEAIDLCDKDDDPPFISILNDDDQSVAQFYYLEENKAIMLDHAIKLAKELSINYYMRHGDENMRLSING